MTAQKSNMVDIVIAPIVEGYGEVYAVPVLLRRVWDRVSGGKRIHVLPPIRQPRTQLLQPPPGGRVEVGAASTPKEKGVEKAVRFAALKLGRYRTQGLETLILMLLDADDDCPAQVGPGMLASIRDAAGGIDSTMVFAKYEFETWFGAAAASLGKHLKLRDEDGQDADAGGARRRKKWIAERFRGQRYSETIDQVALTRDMDLDACRRNSESFRKLWRELEDRWARHAKRRPGSEPA